MPPRPSPFDSPAVSAAVGEISAHIADEALRQTFLQCLTNTLDTTVVFTDGEPPDSYVITGDIAAMWLRDSSAQVWPYVRFARHDERLARMLRGLLARQAQSILLDAYANAFLFDQTEQSEWTSDRTQMRPGVHERKYEVDSLCYPIRLAYGYWQATGDGSPFDATWKRAMRRVIEVWRSEQDHEARSSYRFERLDASETDTLGFDGRGTPVSPTGMTWSGFRPSDDRCELHYLIPSQAFAVVSLEQLAQMALASGEEPLAEEARQLRREIEEGIRSHGIVESPQGERIFAYEVDGRGGCVRMDDANVPSLLSLPYLGYCAKEDPLYRSTRHFVLSEANPYYFAGREGAGVGSPHTPRGRVWPIALTMQALTSDCEPEIVACLRMLVRLSGATYFMHEAVDPDDPQRFSRAWFAWANSLFGELVLRLWEECPEVLREKLLV